MLDRKTKNRDASVELLEDRIKENKNFIKLAILIGTMTMLLSLVLNQLCYYYDVSATTVSLCTHIFILGVFLIGVSLFALMENANISTLIYLKNRFEGNKKC